MRLSLAMFTLLALSSYWVHAARIHHERAYQDRFAEMVGGRTEVRYADGTRCDVVTSTHVIEADFADKWAEAIGQSLHYKRMSDLEFQEAFDIVFDRNPLNWKTEDLPTLKRAGILLIIEKDSDYKYYTRILEDIRYHRLQIDVWIITPDMMSGD